MSRKTLHQLYTEHTGKVSDKWSLYLTEYDRLFNDYRDKPVCLLEIGIQNGGSLEIWSKYFSNATALIGCDINPDCSRLSYDDTRINVIVGDANAPEVIDRVHQLAPLFDIIIDDGSHLSSDIVKSFALYFPRVVEGGVFVAEDLHCSYWDEFEGGLFDPYSSISFFKRLADVINHEHWGVPKARADILRGIFSKYGCDIDVETLSQVHSVEFINSMCVVHKEPTPNNGLGHRVIAGSIELVIDDHLKLNGESYQIAPIFDQANNPWSSRTTPPDETIQYLELTLTNLQQTVAERDEQIANLNQVVVERDALLSSSSWKITAPLRWSKAQLRRLTLLPRLLHFSIKYLGSPKAVFVKAFKVYRREGFAGVKSRVRMIASKAAMRNNHISATRPNIQLESNARQELIRHIQSVDIIVCVHNALDDVRLCLESVIVNTMPPYRLIIVDDGSDLETKSYLEDFVVGQPAVLIRNETATGYTLAANKGLREANSEFIILLNSDTITSTMWLDRMIQCGESDKRIGIVGPLSNTASWQSIPKIFNENGDWEENPLPDGWTVNDFANEIARVSRRIYPRVGFVNGFCLMIKRELIEDIGIFDEVTFARGYGEENDYCLRAAASEWQLAIADDCYIYHSQSKSYSNERRAELSRLAGEALAAKHEQTRIDAQLAITSHHPALEYMRKRCEDVVSLKQMRESITRLYEGKRVLFLLPANTAGGGGNIVILEAAAMRANGVDAWIANLSMQRELFEVHYPNLLVPVVYMDTPNDLVHVAKDFDAVIATLYTTVFWMKALLCLEQPPILGYYVQDFEPDFFEKGSDDYRQALESYTAIDDVVLFTKTDWNRKILETNLGLNPLVIGPSVDIDTHYPGPEVNSTFDNIRISAMVRPITPRRAPAMTLRILRRLKEYFGEEVQITVFGVSCDDPEYIQLRGDFSHTCLGELDKDALAKMLSQSDVFIDCSEFQAMGLTAMEAMATGVAVIGPVNGGLKEVITDQRNGVLVDTYEEEEIFKAACRFVKDREYLSRIKNSTYDVVQYSPEKSAEKILRALFGSTEEKIKSNVGSEVCNEY